MAGASPPAHGFHVPGRTHGDLDMATRPCLPAAIAISTVLEGAMLYIFTNMACTSRGWEELEQGHVIALGVWPVFLSCRSEMRPVKQHKVVRAYCVSLRHRGYPPPGPQRSIDPSTSSVTKWRHEPLRVAQGSYPTGQRLLFIDQCTWK